MLLKIVNRLANLILASSLVRLLGFVADAACLGALIAWIGGVSPRYLGLMLCIDLFLFSIYGLLGEAIKKNSNKLVALAEEAEKSNSN